MHGKKYKRLLTRKNILKTATMIIMQKPSCFTQKALINLIHYQYPASAWNWPEGKKVTLVQWAKIFAMSYFSYHFYLSLLFLALYETNHSLAKQANNTQVTTVPTKQCTNVYNSFYAGPNKKIENILQEMMKQLGELQEDMKILKNNKTFSKGPRNNISRIQLTNAHSHAIISI